ncbi:DUF5359 family protein [Dendrosporobacter sp. 1207_IL3150]|uniref:DUF5359 family protein n=1 Tax=Dendrosporobacter sp. 1207_IL3150 TaxID=3084054 RepID=UPI002FDA7BC5
MRKSAWRTIRYGENVLFKLVIIFICLLVISQCILSFDNMRPYMSRVDKYEGEQIYFHMPQYASKPLQISDTVETSRLQSLRNSKVLILRMVTPPKDGNIFVTVNGKVIDDFRKGEVKLTVYDGDYVEIDASAYKENAQFIVNVPSSSLISPIDGLVLEGTGIISAGKVKFKG